MSQEQEATPSQLAAFQTKAKELAKTHGDFVSRLKGLPDQGLDAHKVVSTELMSRGELGARAALWLSSEDGRGDARALAIVKDDPDRTRVEVGRISRRVQQSGFAEKYQPRLNDADSYREQRREDIRTGKRRVR
jgi:hypothetical protein